MVVLLLLLTVGVKQLLLSVGTTQVVVLMLLLTVVSSLTWHANTQWYMRNKRTGPELPEAPCTQKGLMCGSVSGVACVVCAESEN